MFQDIAFINFLMIWRSVSYSPHFVNNDITVQLFAPVPPLHQWSALTKSWRSSRSFNELEVRFLLTISITMTTWMHTCIDSGLSVVTRRSFIGRNELAHIPIWSWSQKTSVINGIRQKQILDTLFLKWEIFWKSPDERHFFDTEVTSEDQGLE